MNRKILLLLFVVSFSFSVKSQDALVAPYIVGGSNADVADYPFMALLMRERENEPDAVWPFCGGTILDATHILTAAHCVYDTSIFTIENIKVAIDISYGQQIFGQPRVAVKNIYYPENYDNNTLENDIAVLELMEPLPTYSSSHAVTLGTSVDQAYQSNNDELTIIGYGLFSSNISNQLLELMMAKVSYVSTADCEQVWGSGTITSQLICTKGNPLSSSNGTLVTATCQGDSGGPLIWYTGGQNTQIGVVSFGPSTCGDADLAAQSVFTDVSQYLNWIKQAQNGEISPTVSDIKSGNNSSGGSISLIEIFLFSLLVIYRNRKRYFSK